MPRASSRFWQTHKTFLVGVAATLIATVGVYFLQSSTQDFMASVLNVPMASPFDGAALPTPKIPDWARLSSAQYTLSASVLPADKVADLPNYDPAVFGTKLADVNWSASANRDLVNQLITYSTPYMSSYAAQQEYTGSHLAVDIKMSIGTPVYAVANGVVEKAAEVAGFGQVVMIRHDNVPLIDSNETTTLYSTYAHLSKIIVAKGDVIYRGQQIAESGNTGTSTGAHLHFQIDNTNAPWHPWWPFSSADTKAAGVSFMDGIDAGLGKDAAIANTVNPMLWVQRYFTTKPVVAAALKTSTTTSSTNTTSTATDTTSATTNTTTSSSTTTTTSAPTIEKTNEVVRVAFSGDSFAFVGNTATVKITALDGASKANTTFAPLNPITVAIDGDAEVSTRTLTASDFREGVATLTVRSNNPSSVKVTVADTSTNVTFVSEIASVAGFAVTPPDTFLLGSPQDVTIQAVDQSGTPTPSSSIAGTVKLTTSTGLGTFSPETLTANDFKDGKAVVKLTYPTPTAFTIKAQEGALVGTSQTISARLFTDVDSGSTYGNAITYLKQANIIGGYPDGSFQPNKTVSRAEAMKMILGGLNISGPTKPNLKFNDTTNDAWYATWVAAGVTHSIVAGYADGTFRPANTVNRAEYLKMLVNASGASVSTPSDAPYDDVSLSDWFASFADYAKEKNLVPVTNNRLDASGGMTRGEVAETIYRAIVLKKTGAATYSTDLQP